jgi:outer membrane biosynthesis protein TonB
MTDLIGGKPVEAFAQADRVIGKGKELANKLRELGKFVGRDVIVRVKFKGFSALTRKEVTVKRTVRMRPSSANEIRAKYFEIIRNTLNSWRAKFEENPSAFGWYDDVSVASSGFEVEPAPKKKKKKKAPKKKAPKKKAPKKAPKRAPKKKAPKKAPKKKAPKKAPKKKAPKKSTPKKKGAKRAAPAKAKGRKSKAKGRSRK